MTKKNREKDRDYHGIKNESKQHKWITHVHEIKRRKEMLKDKERNKNAHCIFVHKNERRYHKNSSSDHHSHFLKLRINAYI
jgi:hypothetical protein